MVCSFTRTAALELRGRGLPIPESMVGTLHSMAFRGINQPVAFSQIKDWNERHPQWGMKGNSSGPVEESPAEWVGEGEGTKALAEVEILRNRMIPIEEWPKQSLVHFHEAWSSWKAEAGVVDFTDMIEMALRDTIKAPGEPEVMFMDEAQDATPLELALFRHWGDQAERVVIVGDDDQCLYRFRGSTPDAMLDASVPDNDRRVLDQSYRVPAAVLEVADRWVRTLTRRAEKAYKPRAEMTNPNGVKLDDRGKVRVSNTSFGNGDDLVREIRGYVDSGRSVMCIAACSYMLDPLKAALRGEGLPFHNPYRPSRVDWNPMRPGTRNRTSATERLLAYLVMDEDAFGDASRLWTGGDVKAWSKFVKSTGVFRRGAKGAIEGLPNRELSYDEVASLFSNEEELERAVEPSLDWFASHLTAEGAKALEYPIQVYRKHGVEGLGQEPAVTIGTIHSVKGGQSDVVFMCPDVSLSGLREWESPGETRDATIRQFYVAMTRAAEELVICQPKSNLSISFDGFLHSR